MKIVYTATALQNKQRIIAQGFETELQTTLHCLTVNPTQAIKLVGDLSGAYSKTIIANHSVVYQFLPVQNIVKVVCIT